MFSNIKRIVKLKQVLEHVKNHIVRSHDLKKGDLIKTAGITLIVRVTNPRKIKISLKSNMFLYFIQVKVNLPFRSFFQSLFETIFELSYRIIGNEAKVKLVTFDF
jgi:hypothetical protein